MANKILFCDFFGVFVTDSGVKWMKDHNLSHLKDKIFPDGDIGNISEDELFNRIEKVSGIDKEAIKKDFEDIAFLIPETLTKIKEIKKHMKVIILSNAYENVLERRINQFNLNEYFDDYIVSYKIHKVKPNLDFYNYAYNKYGIGYDEIYYVDDNPNNLVEPSKLGWNTVLYNKDTDLIKLLGI